MCYSKIAPAIFLLPAKYFSEPNVQNNKFHGIKIDLRINYPIQYFIYELLFLYLLQQVSNLKC